jgi:hypothetical protein
MTEKQFIKKFIIRVFGCSEYFFESAWSHIEKNYRSSRSLYVWRRSLSDLYDTTRTDIQHDAVKAASILYEAIKEVEKTGKIGQFLALLEGVSKKHKAEEALKLKILKNLESDMQEMRDLLKGKSVEGLKSVAYEDEMLELDLDEFGKPTVKINGKKVTVKERFFVDLAYLAICKIKKPDGWVDVKKELKWTERHIKDYPSDLKDVLEKGSYNKPADKSVFLDRLVGQGKIRLGIFKADPQCIIINENLRNFESEHRWTVKKTIDDIFWELDCRKAGGREIDFQMTKEVMDKLRFDREKIELQELRPMLRHVFVISQAIKIMGWKFHDAQWLREWKKFLKQCDEFYELLKYNQKEREEIGLYLGF